MIDYIYEHDQYLIRCRNLDQYRYLLFTIHYHYYLHFLIFLEIFVKWWMKATMLLSWILGLQQPLLHSFNIQPRSLLFGPGTPHLCPPVTRQTRICKNELIPRKSTLMLFIGICPLYKTLLVIYWFNQNGMFWHDWHPTVEPRPHLFMLSQVYWWVSLLVYGWWWRRPRSSRFSH